MPTASKLTAAIAAAHEIADLMSLARQLREKAAAFVVKYNSEGYSTTWGAMTTAAQLADGSLGVLDVSPVATNPIAVGGLFRSKNQLVSGVTFLNDYASFCGNVAVGTAQRSQSIDDLSS